MPGQHPCDAQGAKHRKGIPKLLLALSKAKALERRDDLHQRVGLAERKSQTIFGQQNMNILTGTLRCSICSKGILDQKHLRNAAQGARMPQTCSSGSVSMVFQLWVIRSARCCVASCKVLPTHRLCDEHPDNLQTGYACTRRRQGGVKRLHDSYNIRAQGAL